MKTNHNNPNNFQMNSHVIQLTEDHAMVVSDAFYKTGEFYEFSIDFPSGASIDYLQLSGITRKCEKISKSEKSLYLVEVDLSSISQVKRFLIRSYLSFLDREKRIDAVYESASFKDLLEKVMEYTGELEDMAAIREFILATLNKETFH